MPKQEQIVLEAVHDFRGKYPNVPLADGIDYDTLVAGDSEPMFVTLPLGAINAISRNERRYNREAVDAIYKAIVEKRVGGTQGHLRDDERSFKFETPSLHWVGAVIEGDVLWGKAYVPASRGDVREYIRIQKATNSRIGTSLYGMGYLEEGANGIPNVMGLEVEQIDLVHPDRVGIPIAGSATPAISRETLDPESGADSGQIESELVHEEAIMPEAQVANPIPETVDVDVRLVQMQEAHQTAVRALTLETEQLKSRVRTLERMTSLLNVAEGADPVLALQALQAKVETTVRENIELLQTAIKQEVADRVAVDYVRPVVEGFIAKMQPKSRAEVKACAEQALKDEAIALILTNAVQKEMGPVVVAPTRETPVKKSSGEITIPVLED